MKLLPLLSIALLFAAPAHAAPPADGDELVVPPPEVEPGSTRKPYEVKEGDTFTSIASEWGFLPDDLRRWNGMPEGEPEPGTVVWMWIAPVEPVSAPAAVAEEGKSDKEPKAPRERAGNDGAAFYAGVQVGPAVSFSELGATVTPRLELGVQLPPLDGALRIFAGVQYLRPAAEGQAEDPRVVDGTFTYDLKQDELVLSFGPAFRFTMLDLPVVPEVAVGPSVSMYRSTINGGAGGNAFPESTEQYTRVGYYAQAGAALALGPGEATLHVALHGSGLNGVVTGEASSTALSPLLGWRFVF